MHKIKIIGLLGIAAVISFLVVPSAASALSGSDSTPDTLAVSQPAPTFAHLREYLASLNKVQGRYTVNTKGFVGQVTEAEKKYLADKPEKAEQMLLKTVKAVQHLVSEGRLQQQAATDYEASVRSLIDSWKPTPPPAVNGGYPAQWADAPMDSIIDSWGFYNRQSPSYAAFKVSQSGRTMPFGFGNAKEWPAKASALGITVDTTPKKGDVAISTVGVYGHAMYVEEVLSASTIRVSDYNRTGQGLYGETNRATSGLQFIHFP